jgi:DNA-binding GntR family transcriptional regulator
MLRDRNDEMYHEHHDLVDALVSGNAEQVAADQIRAAQRMVIDGLLSSPSLQSVNLVLM